MPQRRPMTKRPRNLLRLPHPTPRLLDNLIRARLRDFNLAFAQPLLHILPRDIDLLLNGRYLRDAPFLRYRCENRIALCLGAGLPV